MQARSAIVACVAVLIVLSGASRADAQGSIEAAQELYVSAEYGEALTMLEGLLVRQHPREEHRTLELYRTLCLIAMGRTADADKAVEAIITQDPLYRPNDEAIPPRMRSAFADARRRLLPSIIQKEYTQAKAAFDNEDYEHALEGFQRVLDGLSDPDISGAAKQPPLSDLRTLAAGFHDLSEKASVPAAALPATPSPAPVVAAAPAVAKAPAIYGAEDGDVTPPVTIRQRVPTYPGRIATSGVGIIEVIIDETGAVESATMPVPVSASFDKHALAAAKTWQYQPAKLDGVPVKFRKRIQVAVIATDSKPGLSPRY